MYENLRAEMFKKGISIDAIARLLGVHRNTIQKKLKGESEFTIGEAEIISETIFPEFTIKYLFHRTTIPA